MFPKRRMRRLRENAILREMVAETKLTLDDFVCPLFVIEGKKRKEKIKAMPGIFRYTDDLVVDEIKKLKDLGIKAFLFFGIPKKKDEKASQAYASDGVVQRCIKKIRDNLGDDILLITDVCLCEYTSTGHCGIIRDGKIVNDETLELLSETALSHVKAGADMVAPSDMMDGRVKAIRERLDSEGFNYVPIMSYSVKYASAFYGPFRDAAKSSPRFGDRKSHQMDYSNSREAIRVIAEDIEEGADIVMVKPALPSLDIISETRRRFNLPIAAYQVSGEYSMIKAASKMGYVDEKSIIIESLTSIKRAGADIIISYFAEEIARFMKR